VGTLAAKERTREKVHKVAQGRFTIPYPPPRFQSGTSNKRRRGEDDGDGDGEAVYDELHSIHPDTDWWRPFLT
jgi:hypothetical protein